MHSIVKRIFYTLFILLVAAAGNAQPGANDASFNTADLGSGGANNQVNAIVLQPDGKILIGGQFGIYNGISANRIIRLNADGSRDATFTGTGANQIVNAIALQPDGKILIGGRFTSYDGSPARSICRLNADGARDATFTSGTGTNSDINTIALQPDGKILIGGSFTSYNGSSANRICRLNADGSRDASFTGTGAGSDVLAIALQPDGKILIGGLFTTYNGSTTNRITRLNTDGSRDASFTTGTGANGAVNSIALQPDGNILIGGSFTSYSGAAAGGIIRLNTDGSRDASFTGTGANNDINSIALQPDGNILIAGSFTSYNGDNPKRITRLNADGSIDMGFTGNGADNTVNAVTWQPDGKALIGGLFTTYDGTARTRIARIISTLACSIVLSSATGTDAQTVCQNSPITNITYSTTFATGATFSGLPAGVTGTWAGNVVTISGSPTTAGTYNYTVTLTGGGCGALTASGSITVNLPPDVNQPANQVVCSNGTTSPVNFTGSVPGTFFTWTNNTASIGLAASGSGNIPAFTATNAGNAPLTATVTVTPSTGNPACTGTAKSFTITVNPKATVNIVPTQTVCTGALTTAINFSSPTTGGSIVYNWTNDNPSIGLAASGSGDIAAFTATNTTTSVVNANITVTPVYTNAGLTCNGTARSFLIRVSPLNTIAAGVNRTTCINTAITPIILVTSSATGATFTGLPAGVTGSWSGNLATISGTPTAAGTFNYTVTTTGGCGAAVTATGSITVNPTPDVTQPAGQVVCNNGAAVPVNFTGTVPGTVFNWTNNTTSIGLAVSGTGNIPSFTATNAGNAPVTATVTVIPLITSGEFAYIANAGSNNVSVINTATNTIIATVPVGTSPYGVSASPDGSRVYVTNQFSNNVSVINTASNSVLTTVAVGNSPLGVSVSPDGSRLYVAISNNVSVINTATNTVVATVALGGRPTGVSISPDGSRVYVTNTVSNNVSVINTAANTVEATIPVGTAPFGISVSPDGSRVYVANFNSDNVSVINTATNMVVATVAVAEVAGVAVSPDGSRVYVTTGAAVGSGKVKVINTASNTLVASITAGTSPRGVSVSPDGSRVYVANASSNDVDVINTTTNTFMTNFPVGTSPYSLGNFITAVPSCTGTAKSFTITVNPTATVNTVASQVLCSGASTTAINFSSPTTGGSIVYNWTNDNPSIGLAASGSGDIAAFTATNTGNAPVTATITVTPAYTNAGLTCNGTPATFTITVNPTATVNDVANQGVCNGSSTTAVHFSSPTTGGSIVYNWTNDNPSFGLAASGSGDITAFTATNTSNAPVSATITVTPSYTNGGITCTGTPNSFTITVNPTATVNTIASQRVCNGTSTAAIHFSSPTTGGNIVYNWTCDKPGIGLAPFGSGDIAAFTAINNGNIPVTAFIRVTPAYTNAGITCNGVERTFVITVDPSNAIAPGVNRTTCINTAINPISLATISATGASFTGLPAGVTGSWAANVATISGTPTAAGTFNYTVTTTGGCGVVTATGSITVNPIPDVTQPASQVVCNNGAALPVSFTGTVPGTLFSWTNSTASIGLAARGAGNIPAFTVTNAGNAPVTATVTVTPALTGDVFAYIANQGSNNVSVINTATNTVVATVTVGSGPVGISASPDGSRVYVTNLGSGTVSVINTATNSVVATVSVGSNPQGVSVSPDGSRVYVTHSSSKVSVINTATNAVVATVTVGTNPFGITVSPDGTWVYATNNSSNNVSVINTATNTVVATVAVGTNPQGVSVSPDGSRVYVANNGSQNVSVINTATNTVSATVTVGLNPRGISVSPDGSRVYVTKNNFAAANSVSVINAATNTVVANVPAVTPNGISITPDGSRLYVANSNSNDVEVINTASNTIEVVSLPVGTSPFSMGNFITGVGGCTGTAKNFTITVNPTATVNTVASQVVCSGASTTAINFSSPTTGGSIVYNWTNDNPSIGLAASGSGDIAAFTANNPAMAGPVTATITVTPAYTNAGLTCNGTPTTFTITVNPTPDAVATPASQSVVSTNAISSIVLNGNVSGTVYNWTRDNTATVTGIAASGSGDISGTLTNTTTAPVTVTFTITPTYTNAGTTCTGTPITATVIVDALNVWTGGGSSDMNQSGNWSLNTTPSATLNAIVPAGNTPYPISTADITVKNLTIGTGATVTIGNGRTLTINAAVTGTGTISASPTSNLVIAGAAGTLNFTNGAASLNNLTLNASANATLGTALHVYGTITLNSASLNLDGQNLTLKSNANGTARIADLTGSTLSGAGNVTVERYIKLRAPGTGDGAANYGRAYRLLTPTVNTTGSIKANWMEGAMNTAIGTNINPNPGYGTQISGTGGNANGFDVTQSNAASLYHTSNAVNPLYTAATNTTASLDAKTGYFLYLRGDRSMSMQVPLGDNMPTSSTTLRATGTLVQGTQTSFSNAFVGGGAFNLITNPYPSPIDWAQVYAAGTNITQFYTYWDPNVGNRGGFVTVSNTGVVSGGGTATTAIQSGQAFFVQSNGTGTPTINIQENHKMAGNNNTVFLVPTQSFQTSLYFTETGGYRRQADGVTVLYDDAYSAAVDDNDAKEVINWDENISIMRQNTALSIEGRPVILLKDTIPLRMGNLKQRSYEWQFVPTAFSNIGLKAELVDHYLNKRTLLSVVDTVAVPFSVTADAGSSAADRFMVVFGAFGPLPVDVLTIRAESKGAAGIQVDWSTKAETDMDRYELERSVNGSDFNKINSTAAIGNSTTTSNYNWLDVNPAQGNNYYRVKAIDKHGAIKYSAIARAEYLKAAPTVTVIPNPVTGNSINLQLNDMAKGNYSVTLYNMLGQNLFSTAFRHNAGTGIHTIRFGRSLSGGRYQLVITANDGTRIIKQLVKN